jgi:sugar lactone lactonase YvrE
MRRFTLFAALLAASLAGCGGGSNGAVPIHSSTASQAGQRVPGSIVIHIPSASQASSAALRRVRYVSVSSRSTKVAIAGAQGCTQCSSPITLEVSLVGGNAPCTVSGGVTTCTIALNLLPGSYLGAMTAYDGLLDGQGHVAGNPLSESTSFPITIANAQSNATNVTLAGVPVTLVPTILTPSSLIIDTVPSAGPVYRLVGGNATAQFSIVAKDADGNVIAGPGAPTWTANASGSGFSASQSGNTITLNAPSAVSRQTGTLTVNASSPGCSDSTAKCSLNARVGFAELLAVADHGFPHVAIWPIGASAPIATVTTGINIPIPAVAFGPNGTLFVANVGNNTVTAYAPPYTGAPTVVSTGIFGPVSLAVDAAGTLIVANSTGQSVTFYAPPYTSAPNVTLNFGSGIFPSAVLADVARNRVLMLTTAGVLARVIPPYSNATTGLITIAGAVNTEGLAVDGQGNVYVVCNGNNTVVKVALFNSTPLLTFMGTASAPLNGPAAVAVGADGTVFIASSQSVALYSPAGTQLGASALFTAAAPTNSFAMDADGTVWAGTSGIVQGFTQPYSATSFAPLAGSGFLAPGALAIWP